MDDVQLREVEDADLEVFFEQQLDPVARRRAKFPARDRETFMAHWAKIRADPPGVLRTVVVEGRVAGNVMQWTESGRHWVGFWYGREFWGRGIATAGLQLFLGQVTARPLYADPAASNLASVRVLEKCGFVPATEDMPAAEDGVEGIVHVLET